MTSLAQQRCFNHAEREAAARCPSCRHFYCRECVIEHEHRLLCAQCVQRLIEQETGRKPRLLGAVRATFRFAAGLLLLWAVFWVSGRLMLLVPSEYHDPPGAGSAAEAVP